MASQAFNSIFYDLYDFCTEKHSLVLINLTAQLKVYRILIKNSRGKINNKI